MLGIHVAGGSCTLRRDLSAPEAVGGETRVQVLSAGVCSTDLALRRGYMGFAGVPGHEFVGVALEGPLAGRRVVGEINANCGRCATCGAGHPRHCPQRTVLGILGRPGAFAELLRLPTANLHAVPDSLPNDAAVFVEPLAAACEIAEQVALQPGMGVLVAGDGKLGVLCAHVLAARGATVTVAGRHPERAGLLPAAASHAGDLLAGSPTRASRRFDLVVEATGDPQVLPAVAAWVRPLGTLVLKTTSERQVRLDLAPLVIDELTLVGSRCGPFAPALELLAAATIPWRDLIAARYPLARGVAALDHAARRGVLKVLIENGG